MAISRLFRSATSTRLAAADAVFSAPAQLMSTVSLSSDAVDAAMSSMARASYGRVAWTCRTASGARTGASPAIVSITAIRARRASGRDGRQGRSSMGCVISRLTSMIGKSADGRSKSCDHDSASSRGRCSPKKALAGSPQCDRPLARARTVSLASNATTRLLAGVVCGSSTASLVMFCVFNGRSTSPGRGRWSGWRSVFRASPS